MNEIFSHLPNTDLFNYVILPILIFFARISDVTIGTFRIVMVSKGKKYIAPVLGFFEVTIWIIVISKIMQNMDNWICIVAYASGFATGNFIGLLIEEKVAMGVVKIQIITAKPAIELVAALTSSGYGITHHEARGATGNVSIIYSIINRQEIEKVVSMIYSFNPNAFYSIEDVKFVNKRVNSIFTPQRRVRRGK
jgi:uncharacterized protein YebE (UPF0316 family)